jgi:hypothetical protein
MANHGLALAISCVNVAQMDMPMTLTNKLGESMQNNQNQNDINKKSSSDTRGNQQFDRTKSPLDKLSSSESKMHDENTTLENSGIQENKRVDSDRTEDRTRRSA